MRSCLPHYTQTWIAVTTTRGSLLSLRRGLVCTQHLRDSSDHVGALSWSNNDTVDSEDVDSVSLGILPEL